jgi:hypothetical protein
MLPGHINFPVSKTMFEENLLQWRQVGLSVRTRCDTPIQIPLSSVSMCWSPTRWDRIAADEIRSHRMPPHCLISQSRPCCLVWVADTFVTGLGRLASGQCHPQHYPQRPLPFVAHGHCY